MELTNFKVFWNNKFENTHENEQMEELIEKLQEYYTAHPDENAALIIGVKYKNIDLDGLLIRTDAIVIIELKNYGGKISIGKDEKWYANNIEVKGGSQPTCTAQASRNRGLVYHFLKDTWKRDKLPWIYVMVVFNEDIEFDEKHDNYLNPKTRKWLRATDNKGFVKKLKCFTCKEEDFLDVFFSISIMQRILNLREVVIHSKKAKEDILNPTDNSTTEFAAKQIPTSKLKEWITWSKFIGCMGLFLAIGAIIGRKTKEWDA